MRVTRVLRSHLGDIDLQYAAAAVADEAEERSNGEDVDLDFMCLFTRQYSPQLVGNKNREAKWFLDFGATSHMALKHSAFVSYEKLTLLSIEMVDKSTALAVGRGDMGLTSDRNGTPFQCKLRDVLHVPSFVYYLVFVSSLGKHGFEVRRQPRTVRIGRDDTIGTRVGGLYALDISNTLTGKGSALVANLHL